MHASWPFGVTDPEPEQALEIVTNYFERKYGTISTDMLTTALIRIYALYKENEKRPLVLANKVIALLESKRMTPRAA